MVSSPAGASQFVFYQHNPDPGVKRESSHKWLERFGMKELHEGVRGQDREGKRSPEEGGKREREGAFLSLMNALLSHLNPY